MKKLLVALVLAGLFCIPAFAQDVPRAEVYGGFSLFLDSPQPWGFMGGAEFNLNETLGIVGEFGYIKEKYPVPTLYSFLGGARFSYRAEKFRVFFHGMAGGMRAPGNTEFVIVPGGGLDFSINEVFSVRPVQFDLFMYIQNDFSVDYRYSGGVVFKLGSLD